MKGSQQKLFDSNPEAEMKQDHGNTGYWLPSMVAHFSHNLGPCAQGWHCSQWAEPSHINR